MGVGVPGRAAFWRAWGHWPIAAMAMLLALCAFSLPMRAAAQGWSEPRTVYVSTTGHTSDGLFLDLWRANRELLGDPITEEFQPRTGFSAAAEADVIQYYEHLALVYIPSETPENQVQALDLGRQALTAAIEAGPSLALNRALDRAVCSPALAATCTTIVATGHTLRGPFLEYWLEDETAAWIGMPLSESFTAPDGTRVQYFENTILRQTADGNAEPLPIGTIAAEQAEIETAPIEQPDEVPVYDEELFVPPPDAAPSEAESNFWAFGPGPQQGAWKEIVISISAQSMWAYEEGQLVNSSLVSTGTAEVPETTTPIGFHSVLAKFDAQTMEGTISGEYYRVEDVPFVMYFDDFGNALHGTYWHSNFGAPMSHGCVNLPLDVAAWMYEWAPVGTAVTVVG
jgi:hypothetical protein